MLEATQSHVLRENAPRKPASASPNADRPKLLDQLREDLRSRHYSRRTEQTYCHGVRRYVHFHKVGHPRPQIPERAESVALAVGLSPGRPLEEPKDWRGRAASRSRIDHTEGGERRAARTP